MTLQEFVQKHSAVTDEILSILAQHRIPAEEGERILTFLIGISRGYRAAPIIDERIAEMLAAGWSFAAKEG